MRKLSAENGFTIVEMLVSTTVVLLVLAGALTTFKNALTINDSAAQLADANQNLRAGTNQLVRDLLMAGRLIGTEGIAMPTGPGITFTRPGPGAAGLVFADASIDATFQLPSITTGYQLGPTINNSKTDMVTIMTVDEFMPFVTTPPTGASPKTEGTISADGTNVTLAANSLWLSSPDAKANDTPTIKPGDLVLFVGANGNAIQTVTSVSATQIFFATGDFFGFNQANATAFCAAPPCATSRPLGTMKGRAAASDWITPSPVQVTLFKVLMITYYVDSTTTPGTPRLTRVVNNFTPQALAGVVEDIDLTYDLYDGATNPTNRPTLPYTVGTTTFTASMIRKVNIHVGVRSEIMSKPMNDYVRNHITTSVNVRSLAAVDKYPS
jgi:type II secretory pathway pseudopilin PulG